MPLFDGGFANAIADKIVEHEADYLLGLKGYQPTLETEVADYFGSALISVCSQRTHGIPK
jgi:hypothetical protein